jgi:hypothetical protein
MIRYLNLDMRLACYVVSVRYLHIAESIQTFDFGLGLFR